MGRFPASNLATRVAVAVVGIPLVLGIDLVGGWPFAVGLGVVAWLATVELYQMAGRHQRIAGAGAGILLAIAFAVTPFFTNPFRIWIGLVVLGVVVLPARYLLADAYSERPLAWLITVAGPIYTGLLLGHLALLRQLPDGAWWIGIVLVITWAYDTGAYATGRTIGKRPFMAHVSPKKTWEGVAGGTALAAIAALIAIPALGLRPWQAIVLGVAGAAFAQTGDLIESMIKRQMGVKDSGSIIPGHGGVLDRIDSLLFTSVLVYYLALAFRYAT